MQIVDKIKRVEEIQWAIGYFNEMLRESTEAEDLAKILEGDDHGLLDNGRKMSIHIAIELMSRETSQLCEELSQIVDELVKA